MGWGDGCWFFGLEVAIGYFGFVFVRVGLGLVSVDSPLWSRSALGF